MSVRMLNEAEIAKALAPLAPEPVDFARGVLSRVRAEETAQAEDGDADLGAGAFGVGGPVDVRAPKGWLAKAAAFVPAAALEAGTLSKGAALAKGGGASAGIFAVAVGMVLSLASLVGLLTVGLLRVGRSKVERARREACREPRLSDRMNYREDRRTIGILVGTILLAIYVAYFHSWPVTLIGVSIALLVGTVITLVRLDQQGQGTKDSIAVGFAAAFGQMGLLLGALVSPYGLDTPLFIVPGLSILFLCGLATLWFVTERRAEDAQYLVWFAGLCLMRIGSDISNLLDAGEPVHLLMCGNGWTWILIGQWVLFSASLASIVLVLVTVRSAPKDVFSGPQSRHS